jgi:hypothetical protein
MGMLAPQLLRVKNRLYLLLLPILFVLFVANLLYYQAAARGDAGVAGLALRAAIWAIVVLYVLKGGVLAPIFTGNALREKGRGDQAPFLMGWSGGTGGAAAARGLRPGRRAAPVDRRRRAGLHPALRLAQPALAGLARGRRAAAADHAPGIRLAAAGLRLKAVAELTGACPRRPGCMPSPSAASG